LAAVGILYKKGNIFN